MHNVTSESTASPMTRRDALMRARALWGVPALRISFASLRRKNVVDRYEIGYHCQGLRTVMGRGPSWEAAFAHAGRRQEQLQEEGLVP